MSGTLSKLAIQRGVQTVPVRAVFYGPSGVGKTTLASETPKPLFLDFEGGSHHLSVDRIEPKSWDEVLGIIRTLRDEPHDYQTLVIDTADWAEKLLTVDICRRHNNESIEEFPYGKGWTVLAEAFAAFLNALETLRDRGMHVVFVAHSQIRKFEQPDQTGSFDRYELKLSKQSAPLLKEWSDMLLFCAYETKVVELDGKKKGIGGRDRLLFTSHTAAWDAKNRNGFPEKVPFGFPSIAGAFKQVPTSAQAASPANPPPQPARPSGPATKEQTEKIALYWKTLKKSPEDITKTFAWLGVDAIPGAESWTQLNAEQADRVIALLQKRMNDLGTATSAQIAGAGKEVLS